MVLHYPLHSFQPEPCSLAYIFCSEKGLKYLLDQLSVDAAALVDDTVTMAVQVNGKVRATIEVAVDADKSTVLAAAKGHENVGRWLEGKTLRREIVVPGRLVNLVVG